MHWLGPAGEWQKVAGGWVIWWSPWSVCPCMTWDNLPALITVTTWQQSSAASTLHHQLICSIWCTGCWNLLSMTMLACCLYDVSYKDVCFTTPMDLWQPGLSIQRSYLAAGGKVEQLMHACSQAFQTSLKRATLMSLGGDKELFDK
jgi:hypothetical protein